MDSSSTYLLVSDAADYMVHVEVAAVGDLPWEVVEGDGGNARPGILVEPGTIGTSVEWGVRNVPYVIAGPIAVEGDPGALLEIREGATLRFQEGAWLEVGRNAHGDVRAAGTADNPIVMTADAGAVPGSWVGVLLLAGMTNETVFSRAVIEYAGAPNEFSGETCGSTDAGNVVIVGAPPEYVGSPAVVHDSEIRGSAGYGIAMDRDIAEDLTGEGNLFEDNSLGEQTPIGC